MLPTLGLETVGQHVTEHVSVAARDMGTVTIEVVVAPGSGDEVTRSVEAAASGLPISVRESASVGEGQAELRLGSKEIAIDLAGVTAQITQAVQAALHQDTVAAAYG